MLNFIIALALQPIFILLTHIVVEGIFFMQQEICCSINNLKRDIKQAMWDAEWQYKLLRKDIEKWHTK